jgi:hypothetical protein
MDFATDGSIPIQVNILHADRLDYLEKEHGRKVPRLTLLECSARYVAD